MVSALQSNAQNPLQDVLSLLQQTTSTVYRNDLCPSVGTDGTGKLTIIPFSKLDSTILQPGDIAVYVRGDASADWQSDPMSIIKQRGWHSEMVVPQSDGLYFCAPWDTAGGNLRKTHIGNVASHLEYSRFEGDQGGYTIRDWNLHVFRFAPADMAGLTNWKNLMAGLQGWSALLQTVSWPEPPEDSWKNPVLFSDLNGLLNLGDSLITGKLQKPLMFCIEWVQAVLCLAACYPLTDSFLASRNVSQYLGASIPRVVTPVTALEALPMAPYNPDYIIESFIRTYWGESFDDSAIDPFLVQFSFPQETIMPIVPLLECRRPSSTTNLPAQYICTAVADQFCMSNNAASA